MLLVSTQPSMTISVVIISLMPCISTSSTL